MSTEHAHPPGDFGYGFLRRPAKYSARRRLILAIWLNVAMMIAEVVGGIWSNSLALLSDAGHMFTHIVALLVSLVALNLAMREHNPGMTYGYHRAEPIAALINGVSIMVVVVIIVIEAVKKLIWPVDIHVREMFVIAVAGLIINLVDAMILRESARDDINIRGAFVHLLADLVSSVAIVMGGFVILKTGWRFIDPLLSLVIAGVVGVWGVRLLRQSSAVLMEAVPRAVDVDELTSRVMTVPGVRAVHDVHVWEVSTGMYALTCHVMVDDVPVSRAEPIMRAVNRVLHDEFSIGHTNLQVEHYSA